MAREVQMLAWCDVDMTEGRRVPMAATHEVTVDGKAYTVDLCEDHEADVYKPFAAMVALGSAPAPKGVQGRTPAGVAHPKKGRPLSDPATGLPVGARCLVVECGAPYDGRGQNGLVQHMRTQHGVPLEAVGRICPVCGEVKAPGGGISTHVSKAHRNVETPALTGVVAGWWWASEHGDPHGAIAASGLLAFDPPLTPDATRVQVHPS